MNRAVFLDRDGVINKISEGQFVNSISELELIDGAIEGIKLLKSVGLKVVVVTNMPQVARGLCTESDVEKLHEELKNLLEKEGAIIDAFYYCPHHPETHHQDIKPEFMKYRIVCNCRKPNTGMIVEAANQFDIDVKNSFLIGDRTVDIKTGENAGCRTILVKTGIGGNDEKFDVSPDFTFGNILDAARLVKSILEMKTVILVGGRGERLRPLTDKLPKPMLPIKGRPLLEHLLELNKKQGIEKIVMSGHYLFGKIKDHFKGGEKYGVSIKYVDDGPKPLGSGGALRNCENLLPENFIVMSGDVFTNIDLWELVKFHFNKGGIATLVVRKTDHPQDSDLVEMDKNFKAVKFYGKNEPNKVGDISNASPFIFKKDIIKFIIGETPNLENDAVASAIKSADVYCYFNTKYLIKDIGTPERYRSLEAA